MHVCTVCMRCVYIAYSMTIRTFVSLSRQELVVVDDVSQDRFRQKLRAYTSFQGDVKTWDCTELRAVCDAVRYSTETYCTVHYTIKQ